MSVSYVTSATPDNVYAASLAFDPSTGSFVVGALRQSDFIYPGDAALTYNSVAMTLIGRTPDAGPSAWNMTVGRWTGQSSGSKTLDESGTATERGYLAASFSGVDEASPIVGTPVQCDKDGGVIDYVEADLGTVASGDMGVLIYVMQGTTTPATITGATKGAEGVWSDGVTTIGIAYQAGAGSNITIRADNDVFNSGVGLGFVLKASGGGVDKSLMCAIRGALG